MSSTRTDSSRENNQKSDKLMEVNLQVSGHSANAAESASKSQKYAEETSQATRINVQVGSPHQIRYLRYLSHETVIHNLNRHYNSAAILLFRSSTFCFRAKSTGFLD
jgi:urease accessory protein UreH